MITSPLVILLQVGSWLASYHADSTPYCTGLHEQQVCPTPCNGILLYRIQLMSWICVLVEDCLGLKLQYCRWMGKSRSWRTVLCDTLITHQSLSLFVNFLLGWCQGLSRKGRAAGVSTTLISWLPCSAGWKETRELKWFTLNDLCTTNESMGCQTKENTTRIIPIFRMSNFMSFCFCSFCLLPNWAMQR